MGYQYVDPIEEVLHSMEWVSYHEITSVISELLSLTNGYMILELER